MYSAVSQNLQFFEHNTTLSLILPVTDTYITYHLGISSRYYTYFLPYCSQKSRVGTFKEMLGKIKSLNGKVIKKLDDKGSENLNK